jgi:3-isopropylmalate dehydrogenase
MAEAYRIQVLNQIASVGLKRLPAEHYTVGKDVANPLATILSAAMLLRYSLDQDVFARQIEAAVSAVLQKGLRTSDIAEKGEPVIGTRAMGDAVVAALG